MNGKLLGQRAPLLTDIDASSVLLACEEEDEDDDDFIPEEYLESARPKSGMKSAFMNMANSIMYVTKRPCPFGMGTTDLGAAVRVSLDNRMPFGKQALLLASSFSSLLRLLWTGPFV